jgi:hypothetical protein
MFAWHRELANVPYDLAAKARTRHIHESPYPPSISDICRRVDAITNADANASRQSAIDDAWARLAKAARRGTYYAKRDFPELPEVCRLFLKSPNELTKLALGDEITLDAVTQKAFREFAASRWANVGDSPPVPALPAAPQRQPADGDA